MRMVALNENELEALRILWEGGPLKPAQIQALFSWPIENATLRSVLLNLVEKKHIVRELKGKAFFYTAHVPKMALLRNWAQHLARVFAGGSTSLLAAQLVETSDLAPSDLALLRQTAAASSGKNKRKSK
jgi:BlaI family transcriptional regulator, penicillinase repressor